MPETSTKSRNTAQKSIERNNLLAFAEKKSVGRHDLGHLWHICHNGLVLLFALFTP